MTFIARAQQVARRAYPLFLFSWDKAHALRAGFERGAAWAVDEPWTEEEIEAAAHAFENTWNEGVEATTHDATVDPDAFIQKATRAALAAAMKARRES